jgi:hypothetical protein
VSLIITVPKGLIQPERVTPLDAVDWKKAKDLEAQRETRERMDLIHQIVGRTAELGYQFQAEPMSVLRANHKRLMKALKIVRPNSTKRKVIDEQSLQAD